MSSFTAAHARTLSMKHVASSEAVFDQIRKLCDQRIKDCTKVKDNITYMVPAFIFGLPLFDPYPMYLRLYHSLILRDFEVYSTENQLELYITWRVQPAKPAKSKPSSFEKLAKLRRNL